MMPLDYRSLDCAAAAKAYALGLGARTLPLHSLTPNDQGGWTCSCGRPTCLSTAESIAEGKSTSAGKHPRIREWQVNASAAPEQVAQWWAKWPEANVGIALGTGSGLVSIDLDSEAGEHLVLTLAGDEGLPATLEMITSKGRRRLLFAIPDGLEEEPVTVSVPDPAGGEAVRFQSTGGQCVMPPSLHYSGVRYTWAPGRSPAEFEAAPMPAWLIAKMMPEKASTCLNSSDKPNATGLNGTDRPKEPSGDIPEVVQRFNAEADWLNDILIPAGWKLHAKRPDGVIEVTRPGKSGGCSATIGHHKAKDGTPALHVFSGSVPELPANHAFDKFGAFARLSCGGDTAAAIRTLAATGRFGKLKPKAAAAQTAADNGKPTPESANGLPRPLDGSVRPGINAAELARKKYEPPKFAVDGLLCEGLTIFAGRPKQGKSWLSLLIAYAIAGGHPLDNRKVKPGKVLYLALEDTERRLQQRIMMLREGTKWEIPASLEFRTLVPRSHEGGAYLLHEWLAENSDASLVVIDTLGRFRKPQRGAGNSYAEDYEALTEIKTALDHYKVSGIVVHHTRKMKSEDPFEEISGTQAISGAADGMWVLDRSRGSREAKLYASGRDQAESTTPMLFDPQFCLWRLGKTEEELTLTGRVEEPSATTKLQECGNWLRQFLSQYAFPSAEITEAAKAAGFSFSTLRDAKAALKRNGTLNNHNYGGNGNNDWWSGLGPVYEWRLRPPPELPQTEIPP